MPSLTACSSSERSAKAEIKIILAAGNCSFSPSANLVPGILGMRTFDDEKLIIVSLRQLECLQCAACPIDLMAPRGQ